MDPANSKIILATVILLSCGYLGVFLCFSCLLGAQTMAYTSLSTKPLRKVLGKYFILNYQYIHTYKQIYLSPTIQKANKNAHFFFSTSDYCVLWVVAHYTK